MKSATYPLAIPDALLDEVRKVSHETGLSMADAMRQSLRLGLPKLRQHLAMKSTRASTLRPFTKAEARKAFGRDREWERVEGALARRPLPAREED